METQILELELDLVTRNLWSMILHLPIDRVPLLSTGKVEEVVSSVLVTGAWTGKIELKLSLSLAWRITAAMFEGFKGQLTEFHLADALKELANITGGNVKNALPTPTELSIPTVSLDGAATVDEEPVLKLDFMSGEEPFSVFVFKSGSALDSLDDFAEIFQ